MSGVAQTSMSESVADCTDQASLGGSPTSGVERWPEVAPRPLRKDAERNRTRILDAASELFAEQGLDVGVDEIARRAGVGMGTLYRRFPNKEALVEAILEIVVEQSRADAEVALATQAPSDALRWFILRSLDSGSVQRVFLSNQMWTGRSHELIYEHVLPLLRRMFDNAQAAGSVREDAAFTDFLVLTRAMRGVVDFTERIAPGAWHRQLDMIFDGLRPAVSTSSLKPEPLAIETYRRAATGQSS